MSTFLASVHPAFYLLVVTAMAVTVYLATGKLRLRFFGQTGFSKKIFLTPNEVDFYHTLRAALGPEWVVMAQVSMGALFNTRLRSAHPDYWKVRTSFSSKICDFVVCDSHTLEPQLVVELDDVMHDFNKDKKRDTLTAKAGFRTIRFWSRKKPTLEELRALLKLELALHPKSK